MPVTPEIENEALELFQQLLRCDTTNPPGHERACAEVLAESLRQDGYDPKILEAQPGRSNLVVRRKGDGSLPPLLLTGHLDVVPADTAAWKHPPFGAVIDDGWLYGRGAVDMKNHVAASAMMLKLLAREGVTLKRDVIFAAVADEEAGCRYGADWLVAEHPDEVRAEYALGEIGGFTLPVGNKRLYPIQIAHRGVAWLQMTATGTPGHGSMPRKDSSVQKLARAIMRIGNKPLPVHAIEPTKRMLQSFGEAKGFPATVVLSLLQKPAFTDYVLENAITDPQLQRTFNAVLRNTATPTVVRAGEATNVIPATACCQLDGRLLPGQKTADLVRELMEVVDDPDIRFDVVRELDPVEFRTETPLYETLAQAVKAMDPEGIAMPYVMPGFTDASAFAKLGTVFYGFAPIRFPDEPKVAFSELYHAHDERIPVDGFKKGLHALYAAVSAFCG
ncbi:MAG: M20/M25/M40 family metallo-hydrolase [Myxococcales bacterium]